MGEWLDATWRAAADLLRPRALLLSLLAPALLLLVAGPLHDQGWSRAVEAIRTGLAEGDLLAAWWDWWLAIDAPDPRPLIAPMLLTALLIPLVVSSSVLVSLWAVAPALPGWVARRRFPRLEADTRAPGAAAALGWSIPCIGVAAVALLASLPLWLLPPLALLLPPLVWAWLMRQGAGFSALAQHANATERRFVLHRRRWSLRGAAFALAGAIALWMAIAVAWLGPIDGTEITVSRPPALPLAATLAWSLNLILVYAILWFTHFTLAALQRLRAGIGGAEHPS